ncbi:uncharacterized protein LOC120254813 [Dioscorea cayenensis subsp. rotundata]|uniref:Uncharacterized protein LOC120254813 n=1 Tax=Dioscorea cayennensis subsp. rotundata TaxID=55577 RepID=A0AB40AW10_DIOCR|nr:uncharacterized protein LOC120254813 [Dioscorea cayenensis subsp. rotundata]
MGYVYDGIYRTHKAIKELFKKKHLYKPYTSIIKERWNRTLRTGIHVFAYWLNPAFQFDENNLCQKLEVQRGILDVLEWQTLFKASELMDEMKIFRERQKTFARPLALSTSKTIMPEFLVKPLLRGVNAIGVCLNAYIPRKERLEHQRLIDLVYVHYNLRLQHRLDSKNRLYDLIDYECINKTEFWVVEEKPKGELAHDELESMLEEQPKTYEESTNLTRGGNEDDMVAIEDDDNAMVLLKE